MSTINVQNLLSNVFHPTFVYDTVNNVYKTKLELVNIDTVSANTVSSFFASIGDARCNVYVGIDAGNDHSVMASSSNSNSTFLGVQAGNGTSNVTDSIFIGYQAGKNSVGGSSNTIAIGVNTDGDGDDNIYIGANTGVSNATGSGNIFIGHGISPGALSNQLLIGPLVQPPGYIGSNYLLGGSLTSNFLGINLSNPSYTLDVNGYARIGTNQNGGLGINTNPLDYTLNVNGNMRVSDGYGIMTLTNDVNSNSVTTINPILSNKTATLQVNDGFFSSSGATTGSTYSIPLKRGMFMVSAISNTNVEGYIGISYDSSHQSAVSGSTGALITSNSGSLVIAINTSWSVTYFPSP